MAGVAGRCNGSVVCYPFATATELVLHGSHLALHGSHLVLHGIHLGHQLFDVSFGLEKTSFQMIPSKKQPLNIIKMMSGSYSPDTLTIPQCQETFPHTGRIPHSPCRCRKLSVFLLWIQQTSSKQLEQEALVVDGIPGFSNLILHLKMVVAAHGERPQLIIQRDPTREVLPVHPPFVPSEIIHQLEF